MRIGTVAFGPVATAGLRVSIAALFLVPILLARGVVCTGLAYILFFRLIERAGPAKALSVTFAIPVFAIVYGVVLLGEAVTPWMLVCGLVIVLGTTLSTGMWSLPRVGQPSP